MLGSGAAAGAQRWALQLGDLQLVMFVSIGRLLDCQVLASARCGRCLQFHAGHVRAPLSSLKQVFASVLVLLCSNRPNKGSIKLGSMLQRPAHQVWSST